MTPPLQLLAAVSIAVLYLLALNFAADRRPKLALALGVLAVAATLLVKPILASDARTSPTTSPSSSSWRASQTPPTAD